MNLPNEARELEAKPGTPEQSSGNRTPDEGRPLTDPLQATPVQLDVLSGPSKVIGGGNVVVRSNDPPVFDYSAKLPLSRIQPAVGDTVLIEITRNGERTRGSAVVAEISPRGFVRTNELGWDGQVVDILIAPGDLT